MVIRINDFEGMKMIIRRRNNARLKEYISKVEQIRKEQDKIISDLKGKKKRVEIIEFDYSAN